MPVYQIHRLREAQRQQFRWAPHTAGVTIVKPKDYEPGPIEEASSPYAVWLALRDGQEALALGDLLELESGELHIFKYIGFEEARWYVPEPVSSAAPLPVEVT
jgi:hypothetical protein